MSVQISSSIYLKEKNLKANKQPNFEFAQPTNWDNFWDKDDSESQNIENDSISQRSKRKYKINKTQEVKVDEKLDDDSDYAKLVKVRKNQNSANQI